jgi:hypothetical protein
MKLEANLAPRLERAGSELKRRDSPRQPFLLFFFSLHSAF